MIYLYYLDIGYEGTLLFLYSNHLGPDQFCSNLVLAINLRVPPYTEYLNTHTRALLSSALDGLVTRNKVCQQQQEPPLTATPPANFRLSYPLFTDGIN
jgi:hypothetical protein